MNTTHTNADKAQINKSNAVANNLPKVQTKPGSVFQFVDNRSEAIVLRKIQASVIQLGKIYKKTTVRNVTFDPALLDLSETEAFYIIRELNQDEPHLSIPKSRETWHVTFGHGNKVHFNGTGRATKNIGLSTAEIGVATNFFSRVTGLNGDCSQLLAEIQADAERSARVQREAKIRTDVMAQFLAKGLKNIRFSQIDIILKRALGEVRMPNEDELSEIIKDLKNPDKPKNQKRGIEESQEVNNPNNRVINNSDIPEVNNLNNKEQEAETGLEKESKPTKKAKVAADA
jgi:hypothetical protein